MLFKATAVLRTASHNAQTGSIITIDNEKKGTPRERERGTECENQQTNDKQSSPKNKIKTTTTQTQQ